jgi:hypothetical protein
MLTPVSATFALLASRRGRRRLRPAPPMTPVEVDSPTRRSRSRTRAGAAAIAGIGACCALAALPAPAEVFKCAGPGNVPVYQDTPCPAGRELRNFQTNPPEITVLPAPERPAETRAPADARRAPKEAAPPRPAAAAVDTKTQGDAAARRFVRPGMTEGEVIARLGQPEVASRGAKNKAARWTYLPAAGDPETITIIQFANGVVTNVERKVSKR